MKDNHFGPRLFIFNKAAEYSVFLILTDILKVKGRSYVREIRSIKKMGQIDIQLQPTYSQLEMCQCKVW